MRAVKAVKITNVIADLCIKANCSLRSDLLRKLESAYKKEPKRKAKAALEAIIKNAKLARRENLAICQDTGLPIVFIEIGQNVRIKGDLKQAINRGIVQGYKRGCFRESIVSNPLVRMKPSYQGAVVHTELVRGNKVKITLMPKGFGCENKSLLKMFLPTAGTGEIKKFVIGAVKSAGPDACPPYVVGVGIGGSADYASLLAKKALLKKGISTKNVRDTLRSRVSLIAMKGTVSDLENDLLKEINRLKIGPMGLGGQTTCLAVNIETYPTHIAGLPVAVNISCHALRSATKVL